MPTAYVEAVARQLPGYGCYNNQFATGGKHFTKKIATVGNFFSATPNQLRRAATSAAALLATTAVLHGPVDSRTTRVGATLEATFNAAL